MTITVGGTEQLPLRNEFEIGIDHIGMAKDEDKCTYLNGKGHNYYLMRIEEVVK